MFQYTRPCYKSLVDQQPVVFVRGNDRDFSHAPIQCVISVNHRRCQCRTSAKENIFHGALIVNGRIIRPMPDHYLSHCSTRGVRGRTELIQLLPIDNCNPLLFENLFYTRWSNVSVLSIDWNLVIICDKKKKRIIVLNEENDFNLPLAHNYIFGLRLVWKKSEKISKIYYF